MSATRARPPISGQGTGIEKGNKRHVTDEGRQRLSELARERHRRGELGKPRDGQRVPRRPTSKRRIAQLVAEAARDEKTASDIIQVFKDGIADTQPQHIRQKAAEAWIKIEQEEAKLALREADSDSVKRDRGELLGLLSEGLTRGHTGMLLRKQIEAQSGITDAVIDVDSNDVYDVDEP